MSVALVTPTHYRPFFQALLAPAKLVYAVFLKALGYLLSFLGAQEWGKALQVKGRQIDSRCTSLLTGLWAYGRRFLIHSDNSEQTCRGSCDWFIYQHFNHPEKPLNEFAKAFEEGAPPDAIALHKQNLIPRGLIETKLWSHSYGDRCPSMPQFGPGVYTFLLGFSKEGRPLDAHRFALIKREEETVLFDPNTGLSKWVDADWEPLLHRIEEDVRRDRFGCFTIECYSYRLGGV